MTTVLDRTTVPLRFDCKSDEQRNFLTATENYAMALDDLQSAAAELRAAFGTLALLAAQCRLVAAGTHTVDRAA